ncbi:hypothetical protein RYX36_005174 [Vicia faba]
MLELLNNILFFSFMQMARYLPPPSLILFTSSANLFFSLTQRKPHLQNQLAVAFILSLKRRRRLSRFSANLSAYRLIIPDRTSPPSIDSHHVPYFNFLSQSHLNMIEISPPQTLHSYLRSINRSRPIKVFKHNTKDKELNGRGLSTRVCPAHLRV